MRQYIPISTAAVTLPFLLFLHHHCTTNAFTGITTFHQYHRHHRSHHHNHRLQQPTKLRQSKSSSSSDFDDFSSSSNADDEACRDLTSEFYRQIRAREKANDESLLQEPTDDDSDDANDRLRMSPEEARAENRRWTGLSSNDEAVGVKRKFTGRSSNDDATVTKRVEVSSSSSSSSTPQSQQQQQQAASSPREAMMRSEFNLVSAASSERSLLIQAIAILVSLAFVVYIGSIGGITDGSERFGGSMEDIGGFLEFDVDTGGVVNSGGDGVVGDGVGKAMGEGTPWI